MNEKVKHTLNRYTMDKVCDTCLYGIRAEDNKLGCLYSGICHTRDGEKTAWTPKKAQQYADLKDRVVQDSLAAIPLLSV